MQAAPSSGFLHLLASFQRPSSSHVFILEGEQGGQSQLASTIASHLGRQIHEVAKGGDWEHWVASIEKASQKDWILFFDEADVLFGKRTSVQDSHQRFAELSNAFNGLIFLGVSKSYLLPTAFTQCAKAITVDRYKL